MKKVIIAYLVISLFVLDVMAQSQSTDFLMKLKALPGVSDIKPLESDFFKEKYVMKIQQNLDGDDASKGVFNQRIIVGLRGLDRPTVIVTEGYFAHYALYPSYKEELCQLFDANVVVCEYRYFAESVPEIVSNTYNASAWDYLTVDNSLRDIHHVRQTIGQIFKGKWVSTGISKGGQTTMFYRATYPDDVDVSVSYVAPLNKSVEDGRHEPFLAKKVGTKEERNEVFDAQEELMERKTRLLPRFEQYVKDKNFHFSVSAADVYDFCVMEYPFALWQWGTPVSSIPEDDASDEVWFKNFMDVSSPDYFSCPSDFTPFFVQAARELGYYGYSRKGLKKWQSVKSTKGYLYRIMLPAELRDIKFDKTLYKRTVKYLKKNDPKHIFIYGEIDPWSASGVAGWLDCSKKQNMRVYVQPRGSHRARIGNMPEGMKAEIMSRLTEWLK